MTRVAFGACVLSPSLFGRSAAFHSPIALFLGAAVWLFGGERRAESAEAFAEDDVARYFIDVPDREHWTDQQKWDLHVEIMEYITYAHILKGLAITVGDFEAVALW